MRNKLILISVVLGQIFFVYNSSHADESAFLDDILHKLTLQNRSASISKCDVSVQTNLDLKRVIKEASERAIKGDNGVLIYMDCNENLLSLLKTNGFEVEYEPKNEMYPSWLRIHWKKREGCLASLMFDITKLQNESSINEYMDVVKKMAAEGKLEHVFKVIPHYTVTEEFKKMGFKVEAAELHPMQGCGDIFRLNWDISGSNQSVASDLRDIAFSIINKGDYDLLDSISAKAEEAANKGFYSFSVPNNINEKVTKKLTMLGFKMKQSYLPNANSWMMKPATEISWSEANSQSDKPTLASRLNGIAKSVKERK